MTTPVDYTTIDISNSIANPVINLENPIPPHFIQINGHLSKIENKPIGLSVGEQDRAGSYKQRLT